MSQSKLSLDCDCTRKCRSRCHCAVLTAAVTKRSVTDSALASFLRSTCYNFLRSSDDKGRVVLHMAASRGRRALLEWLCRNLSPNPQNLTPLDIKDLESGYTALHRSIFYGQIDTAVALMRLGASPSVMDNDDFNPIDHAILDRPLQLELNKNMPCEVYVWGTNANYTSGTGSQHQRNTPELLTTFTKQNIHIKQVCLSKFHSVFVSSCGRVWACGHGEGGRLGTAAGATCVRPTELALPEECLEAAVGRDHTVLLMQSGTVMTCGLNDHHQLGLLPPPPSVLAPRVTRLRLAGPRGVCAARYHSLAYSARALYTWGLNGGQLGHTKDAERTVVTPKKVLRFGGSEDSSTIECVAVSDGATVAVTSRGDIYLLYQFQCKKIASRQHNIKSVQVVGGETSGGDKLTEYQKQLSVLVLNSVGNIYLWQDTNNQLIRCIFSMNRPVIVMETAFTRESVMITTKQGEAFHGTIIPKKLKPHKNTTSCKDMDKLQAKAEFNKFIDRDDCMVIKLKRLPNIHRAVDICGDIKGNNFAVLQVAPNSGLLDLPQITSSQLMADMTALLDDANEYDMLHDVLIKVDNQTFPAHKFIISNGSEYLAKLCGVQQPDMDTDIMKTLEKSEKLIINIENVHPTILKQILLFLYTGTCDLLNAGPSKIMIMRETSVPKDDEPQYVTNGREDNVINFADDISAFEAYNKKDKSKKANKKNRQNKSKLESNNSSVTNNVQDPVRLLQEAAKKLQVTSLYKILSRYYYCNGCVMIKHEEKKPKIPKFGFNRGNMTELWDTSIKCLDKYYIEAHRCILSARLDYFNGMFAHSWTESSKNATITLPIHSSILEPIINFLYTDECPEIKKTDDLEFLCNMLVVSDQLFITRLREMCEVTFSSLLTLKNVPEIFQLADTCNCPQLKKCCMEYISLNLPTLLESKALESTSAELLQNLNEYYSVFNPAMCSRVITPFSEAPCDEIINQSAVNYPINLEENYEEELTDEIKKDITPSSGKKKIKVRNISFTESERARKRNESVSSVASLDLSHEKCEDVTLSLRKISNTEENVTSKPNSWVKVNTTLKKQQKVVEARLKLINAVKENSSIIESYPESFTKLIKQDNFYDRSLSASSPPAQSTISRNNSFGSPTTSSSPTPVVDLDFNYSPQEILSRSPQTSLNIMVVNTKLSQKQRKKLALENKDQNFLAEQLDKLNMKKSLPDNSNGEASATAIEQPVHKNPWQKIQPTTVKLKEEKVTFSDILEDERKQKENFTKMMAKPLALTLLEDKAIEELNRFYFASSADEERITVKRVQCFQLAAPQWINRSISTLN